MATSRPRPLILLLATTILMVACGSDDGSLDKEPGITVVEEESTGAAASDSTPSDSTDPTNLDPSNPMGPSSTTGPVVGSSTTRPSTATSSPSTPTDNNSSGPSITVSSVSPSSVSLGGTVSVSFSVADSGGISFVATSWRSSSGNQVNACPNGMGMTPTGGSSTNATYQAQCTLPGSGLPSGTYTISLLAEDVAGNRTTETTTFTVL